jgi:enoyl-CoA hydratase/carnithine racemase
MHSADPTIVRIRVPQRLNPETISTFCAQWAQLDFGHCAIVVLHGDADSFCLGMDLQWLSAHNDAPIEAAARAFSDLLQAIRRAPCITLALAEGAVTGGGLGICAACDIVLAGADSRFRLTEGLIGLTPGVILPALRARLSRQAIVKLVITAQNCDAREALNIGLIDEIAAPGALDQTLETWITALRSCKKQSVADLKTLLHLAEQESG